MELIAHRGASKYAPENTLPSFLLALEMGAGAVEFDVQMTKDNQLVVIHDYYLNRTTNGEGFVMYSDLDYIRSLDAGAWMDDSFKGVKVPLLEEVLELLPKNVVAHIEIKKPELDQRNVASKVLEITRKYHPLSQVVFSSFNHGCLKQLLNEEQVQVGVLMASSFINPVSYMKQNGLASYSLNQSADYISKALVEEAHNMGLKVLSYTIDDVKLAALFREMGVDGIFTNDLKIGKSK